MKRLFAMVLFLLNTILWTIVLITRLNEGAGWDGLTIVHAACAAVNLLSAILNFLQFRKAREEKQAEKEAEKKEKSDKKKRG